MKNAANVKEIQKAADAALDAMYLCAWGSPERVDALAIYNGHVEALVGLLGAEAPCYDVDPDLYQFFYDAYENEYGYKPRGSRITREEAKAWIAARRDETGRVHTMADIEAKKSREIQADILSNGIGEKAPSALALAMQMAGAA